MANWWESSRLADDDEQEKWWEASSLADDPANQARAEFAKTDPRRLDLQPEEPVEPAGPESLGDRYARQFRQAKDFLTGKAPQSALDRPAPKEWLDEQPKTPLIEQRGAPVTEEYYQGAKRALEAAPKALRVQADNAPGFKGSVAKAANREIQAIQSAPDVVRKGFGAIEDRAERYIEQGATADTATNLSKEDILRGLPSGLMRSASPVIDESISDMVVRRSQDLGLSAAQIPAAVVKGFADIAQLVSAGTVGADTSELARENMRALNEMKSGEYQLQQEQFRRLSEDRAKTGAAMFNFLLDNPTFLVQEALPSVGSMALPVGASVVTNNMLQAAKWLKALPAAERAAKANAIREAVVLGTTSAQNAADTFVETDGGLGDKYMASAIAAIGTLVAGKATGGGAEGTLARLMVPGGRQAAAGAIPGILAREVGKEFTQEFGEAFSQSAGKQFGETGAIDPRQAIKQGVTEGTMGAVIGGGAGVLSAMPSAPQVAPIPAARDLAESHGFLFNDTPAQPAARLESFTPPDSPTAQAGLQPIVVPVPTAPRDLAQYVDPALEQDLGLGALRMGGANAGVSDVPGGLAGRGGAAGGGDVVGGMATAGRVAGVAGPGGLDAGGTLAGDAEGATVGGPAGQQPAPVKIWAGRAGDGYVLEQDANQALPGLQRKYPGLSWSLQRDGEGKFFWSGTTQQRDNAVSQGANLGTTQIQPTQPGAAQGQAAQPGFAVPGAAGPSMGGALAGRVAAPQAVGVPSGPGQLAAQPGSRPLAAGTLTTPEGASTAGLTQPLRLAAPVALSRVGKAIRQINAASNVDAELYDGPLTEQQQAGSAVARLLNLKVAFLKTSKGQLPNGFVVPAVGDRDVYIAEDADDVAVPIVVHEAFHLLDKPLKDRVKGAIGEIFREDRRAEFAAEFDYDVNNKELMDEEIGAFLAQAVSRREDFLTKLRDKLDNKDFVAVIGAILGKLRDVMTGAKREYGDGFLEKYVKDIPAAVELLSSVYADAINQQGINPDPKLAGQIVTSDVAQSKRASDVNGLGLYSELARKVEAGPNQAMPDQWKGYIRGLTTKGVKPDEIEWSGVEDFIELKRASGQKVTRAEVAEYLKQGGVQVEETVLGYKGGRGGYRVEPAADGEGFNVVAPDGEGVENFSTRAEAESWAESLDRDTGNEGGTKYGQYTLPGGENYREVLLTLPVRLGVDDPQPLKIERRDDGAYVLSDKYGPVKTVATMSEAQAYRERRSADDMAVMLRKRERDGKLYRSSHWDQPNVLAHIRVNDRTDADGKKVLFVEELQSDWGQEGKRLGFQKGEQMEGGQLVYDPEERNRPPAAPFVTKTEGWLNLALKRVMTMAVEGGYDKVAFVNGEQSAERFSLDKRVDSLSWESTRTDGAARNVELRMPNSNPLRLRVDGDGAVLAANGPGFLRYEGSGLDEIVGKELAQKVLAEPNGRLSGDGLKIEAKGMRAFYDTIVPTALKKLLPKVGGGQLGVISLENGEAGYIASYGGGDIEQTFDTKEDAMNALRSEAANSIREYGDGDVNGDAIAEWMDGADASIRAADAIDQPGFDVTDAMREKIAGGLPLFANRAKGEQAQAAAASDGEAGKRVGSVDTHILAAVRGERATSDNTVLTKEEKLKVSLAAKKLKLTIKQVEEQVREHKAAHPIEDGWAPLVFNGAKKDEATGKYELQYKTVPYGFNNGKDGKSLKPGTGAYKVQVGKLAGRMLAAVREVYQRAQSGDAAARKILDQSGWYKEMRTRLRQEFGGLGDLFADLLGATSPNTPVRTNWDNSVEALRLATTGAFDELMPKWIAWAENIDAAEVRFRAFFNDMLDRGLSKAEIKRTGEYKWLASRVAEARELPEELMPLKSNGKKFGFNGKNVVRAMVDLWRVVKNADPDIKRDGTAPKAINFSGNLIGFRARATIDVWAARMLQRLAGLKRIPSMAEGGVSGDALEDGRNTLQFGFGQDVFSEAVDLIRRDVELSEDPTLRSINDDDLQALVWFIEKEVWTKGNWTSAAGEGGSFELESDLAGIRDRESVAELRRIADSSVASTPEQRAKAEADIARLREEIESLPGIAEAKATLESNAQRVDASKVAPRGEKLTDDEQKAIRAQNQAARETISKIKKSPAGQELRKQIDKALRVLAKPTVEESQSARRDAVSKLKGMARTVDRYVGGISIQKGAEQGMPPTPPTNAEMAELAESMETAIIEADDGATVIAVKAIATEGLYGSVERSLDLEAIVRQGFDPRPMAAAVFRAAHKADQDAAFVARVLRPDEDFDPLMHRPGVEIYFRDMKQAQESVRLMEEIAGKRVGSALEVGPGYFQIGGYTIIVDGRRTPKTRSGEMGTPVGMRVIYMPEFEARYGMDPRLEDASENHIRDIVNQRAEALDDFANAVLQEFSGVSFAGLFNYEVDVRFAGEYEGAINAYTNGATAGQAGQGGSSSWKGRSVRESIAAATGRLPLDEGQPGRELPGRDDSGAAGQIRFSRRAGSDAAGSGRDRAGAAEEVRQQVTPSYGKPREGSSSAVGYHYSQQPRTTLSSAMYGAGLRGAEMARLEGADPRLKQRVYFYIDRGTGINPEAGVGGYAHRVRLENLYDLDEDALRLARDSGGSNEFEVAVLDAGFDGYMVRDAGPSGNAVLLGKHAVPVEQLGSQSRMTTEAPVPPARDRVLSDAEKIAANKLLPAGQVTGKRWSELVSRAMPEIYGRLADHPVWQSDKVMYRNELAKALRSEQPVFSKRVTDTPEFKAWFGDSKIVDESGQPLVMYHGTGDSLHIISNMRGAIYFSPDPEFARDFAESAAASIEDNGGYDEEEYGPMESAGANIIPVYLSVQNPFDPRNVKHIDQLLDAAGYTGSKRRGWSKLLAAGMYDSLEPFYKLMKSNGFDGFYEKEQDGQDFWNVGVFSETQIKSATGNNGQFDPANPDIRYSKRVTDTPEFKRWFGDSKVVDAKGEPLVVYHGTTEDFDAFREGTGWFTVDPGEANFWGGMQSPGANVMPAYLSIKNPRILQAATASRQSIYDALSLLRADEDGVLVMENGNIRWAVVAEPTQIKSATGNSGAFNSANPDIRYSKRVTDTPEFKRWFGDSKVVDAKGEPLVVYHGSRADIFRFDGKTRPFGGVKVVRRGDKKLEAYVMDKEGNTAQKPAVTALLVEKDERGKEEWIVMGYGTAPQISRFSKADEVAAEIKRKLNPTDWATDRLAKLQGASFFAEDAAYTNVYSTRGRSSADDRPQDIGPVTYPVYLSIQNPVMPDSFEDFRPFYEKVVANNPDIVPIEDLERLFRMGHWALKEGVDGFVEEAKRLGYDGFLNYEGLTTALNIGIEPRPEDLQKVWVAFYPTQIKSAIGNNGQFDPANPDIRYSKRAGKARDSWLVGRDEAGRFTLGLGVKAYDGAAWLASKVLDKLKLKPISTELGRSIRKMKVQIEKSQALTADVAKRLQVLTEDERQLISDVIEREVKAGVTPPQRVLSIAASMSQIMSEQSAELVRLGMLDADTAKRLDGKYLPRFYEKDFKNDVKKMWEAAAARLRGRKKVMQGISGKHLKARGLWKEIAAEELADWEAQGWEQRDQNYQAGDETVWIWRDYTRDEREQMGEIRDAMFRFIMGYMQSQKDIALGRLYESLAQSVAKRKPVDDTWVQVPTTTISDESKVRRYGKLAGKWVPAEVMDHLADQDHSFDNELLQLYRKGLSLWKEGKVVLNPVSHANNIISNLTAAHFAGVSYWHGHKYAGAMRDLVKGDPMVEEAREAGLFVGSFSREELLKNMPEQMRMLAGMTESAAKKGARHVWNALSMFLRKPAAVAYDAEDKFFRYLIYRDARKNGLTPDDAVDYAQKYIFTYDDLPKGARLIRDTALPFFSYTYKAIPMLAETAVSKPWRYAAPAAVVYGANQLFYALAQAMDDDDDDTLVEVIKRYFTDDEFKARVKGREAEEAKNLPPWMQGYAFALGVKKTVRLGTDDVTGLPMFLDVSRWLPGGDIFDTQANAGGIPLPQPFTPNHPILTIFTGLIGNRDLFTGDDLVDKEGDTTGEKVSKWGSWMWRQMAPAVAVGNYHFERNMNAVADIVGKPIQLKAGDEVIKEYTGIDKGGLPVQPGLSALQTFGVKARPIDLELSDKIEASKRRQLIRELEARVRGIKRQESRGSISSEAAETQIEYQRTKILRLREGLDVDGDSTD